MSKPSDIYEPNVEADSRVDVTWLPPIGECVKQQYWDKVNTLKNNLQRETQEAYSADHAQADSNLTAYRYSDDPPPGPDEVTSNQIMDDVHEVVNELMDQPPSTMIKPPSTNSAPIILPIFDAAGMPLQIDETTQAKFWQRQYDFYFERGRIMQSVRAITLKATIAGYWFGLFEMDWRTRKPKLWHTLSIRQVAIDPQAGEVEPIDESQYVWWRWYIDRWRARVQFPDQVAILEDKAESGPPRSDGQTQLGTNANHNYYRKMCDITHIMLRDQPVRPFSIIEALNSGMVSQDPLDPDENLIGGDGRATPAPVQEKPQSSSGGIPDQPEMTPQTPPSPDLDDPNAALEAMPVFYLSGTNTKTNPRSTSWPQWLGKRHLVLVNDVCAVDELVTYWDFPLVSMIGLPKPNSSTGIGHPEKTLPLQRGDNSFLTSMKDYGEFLAHPATMIPNSTYELMGSNVKKLHMTPKKIYVVDDDLLRSGNLTFTINPPPLNQGLVQLHDIFSREKDQRSSAPPVSQGKQEGDITGWQTTQMLIDQAGKRHNLQGQWLADMLWRVGNLLLHELIYGLTPDQLAEVCAEYPPEVCAIFQKLAQQTDMIVEVEGSSQSRKQADAIQKFNVQDDTGERVIGMKTLRTRLGEDNEKEQKEQAPALMAMAAQKQQEQAKKPGGKEPPGNQPPAGGPPA